VTPSRETTSYTLTFEASKLNEAVDLLGDILLNSVYNKN
jgi:predicted Zn-dependent peptidase